MEASGRAKCQQLESAPDRRLEDFAALRAESDANAEFAQSLADQIGSHSENSGDGQQCAQQTEYAQSNGCGARREKCGIQFPVPGADGEGQAGVEAVEGSVEAGGDFLRSAVGAHDEEGCAGR